MYRLLINDQINFEKSKTKNYSSNLSMDRWPRMENHDEKLHFKTSSTNIVNLNLNLTTQQN